jgi:hypothetical protein
MSRNTWWGKTLRIIGIVFMGITALFTIASGAGTSCVALNPAGFGPSMALLAPFQWLYILFVIVTTAIGIIDARAVALLARGKKNSYRYALTALILGILVGVVHMLVSRALRGKSMPVDAIVYTSLLTLAIFLLFRIPKIWQAVDYTSGSGNDKTGRLAAAIALLVCGVLTLGAPFWASPSHTWDGVNWAAAFLVTSTMLGLGQVIGGAALLILPERAGLAAGERTARA